MRQLFLENAHGSIRKISSGQVNPLMNMYVSVNFSKLQLSLFYLPLVLLASIFSYLFIEDALRADSYIQVQKELFFLLNSVLSSYPRLQYNMTETGNTLVVISFLSIFILHAPRMWESLASALIISCLFSRVLKKVFAVPRPAAFFDNDSFVIIGKTLAGHNSLPSGHSITIFTALSIVMFAFMPLKSKNKILWCGFLVLAGLMLIFTRVALGAHYPIDVVIGGIFGYISALAGIFLSRKYALWKWINDKKYYPLFITAFAVCWFTLAAKILSENLIIFYLSLFSLTVSLIKITSVYVKR